MLPVEQCDGSCHHLMKRKPFQDILNGNSERLWRHRKERIKNLEMKLLTEVADSCFEKDDWTSWYSLNKTIEEQKKTMESDLMFEMALCGTHSLIHQLAESKK